jgi:hypothetical protein
MSGLFLPRDSAHQLTPVNWSREEDLRLSPDLSEAQTVALSPAQVTKDAQIWRHLTLPG